MWLKVYVLVKNLAVVPTLWTFNFTQYQGLHAASGSHRELTGNFEIPWDSTGTILFESQWNSQLGFHWNSVGSHWDAWFSVGFPSLSSQWNSHLRSRVGFAGTPPRIPVIFSRWIPADSSGIPAGISLESHSGSQLHFLWSLLSRWKWNAREPILANSLSFPSHQTGKEHKLVYGGLVETLIWSKVTKTSQLMRFAVRTH